MPSEIYNVELTRDELELLATLAEEHADFHGEGQELAHKLYEILRGDDPTRIRFRSSDEGRMEPDPDCYSCGGTGEIQWSGAVRGQRCPCTYPDYWEESGEGKPVSFKRGYMHGYRDAVKDAQGPVRNIGPSTHPPQEPTAQAYNEGYDDGFEVGLKGDELVRPAGVSDDYWDGMRDGHDDALFEGEI